MSTHQLVDFFSQEESSRIINQLDKLEKYWIRRDVPNGNFFYTFSKYSSVDCIKANNETIEEINKANKFLINSMPEMYEILIKKLESIFGKCELANDIPIPGFFIYTERDGVQNRPNGIPLIHTDGEFGYLDYYWNRFSKVEHESSFGFTIALELPKSGAGMCLWDEPDYGFYSNSEWAQSVQKANFYTSEQSIDFMDNRIKNKTPNIVEYSVGKAMIQQGEQIHSVAHGVNLTTNDRRITLQGFGKKCDGVWRLFF